MKRLHGLLAAAEEKKQRLEGLRQTEEGKEKAKQEGWADAIRVAGGAELKDNPAALKKMIKRREKDKAKSAAKWDDRLSSQRKEQSKRQDKREENLNRRKKGGAAGAVAAEGGDAARVAAGEGGKVGVGSLSWLGLSFLLSIRFDGSISRWFESSFVGVCFLFSVFVARPGFVCEF